MVDPKGMSLGETRAKGSGETGSLSTRSTYFLGATVVGGGSQPIARLTPMPTRQHRYTCLSSFNEPRHAVLHQGAGWGLDTRAPGRAGTWLGMEAPPCRPTDSVPGLSFTLRSDFRPMSSPGRGCTYFLAVLWARLSWGRQGDPGPSTDGTHRQSHADHRYHTPPSQGTLPSQSLTVPGM